MSYYYRIYLLTNQYNHYILHEANNTPCCAVVRIIALQAVLFRNWLASVLIKELANIISTVF